MLSTCVVVDHRRDDFTVPKNNIRGDLVEFSMEKYFDLPLPENKIVATYIWIDGTGEHLRYKDKILDYIPKTQKDNLTLIMEDFNKKIMDEMVTKMKCSCTEKYLPPHDYSPRNLEKHYITKCRIRTERNINAFDENIKG